MVVDKFCDRSTRRLQVSRLRLLGYLALAMLAGGSVARATETVEFDGVWWAGLSELQKVSVVQGIIGAFPSGWISGAVKQQELNEQAVRRASTLTYAEKAKVLAILKQDSALAVTPSFSKTFGTYIHGIDDFFANHPDRMTVHPEYMIDCLQDAPTRSCDSVGELK